MSEILSYGICTIILFLVLGDSIKKSLNTRTIKFVLEKMLYYFSIFVAFITLYFKILGKNIIIILILTICSTILDIT